jgi:hypothetical protein
VAAQRKKSSYMASFLTGRKKLGGGGDSFLG